LSSYTRYIYVVFITIGLLVGWAMASASGAIILNLDAGVEIILGGVFPLSNLIGAASAVLTVFLLLKNNRAVQHTNEVIGELVKVTWPTREETTNNSIVVVLVTIVFSGSLAMYDYVWAQVTEKFLFSLS